MIVHTWVTLNSYLRFYTQALLTTGNQRAVCTRKVSSFGTVCLSGIVYIVICLYYVYSAIQKVSEMHK